MTNKIKSKHIRIKIETKEKLDELKVHPNQSYNELIENLIKVFYLYNDKDG